MVDVVAPQPGWKTALEIIISPKAVFERLAQAPKWVWAFLIASILGIIGSLILAPTFEHYLTSGGYAAEMARNPAFQNMPAEKRDAAIAQAAGFTKGLTKFGFIFVPFTILIGGVINSILMLIGSAAGGGKGSFAKFWSISMHVSVVTLGIGSLLNAIIVTLRGADSFNSLADLGAAVPGLALLIPASAVKLHAFFGAFNVVTIWGAVLFALGMIVSAHVKRVPAAITAFMILAIFGLFSTLSAN